MLVIMKVFYELCILYLTAISLQIRYHHIFQEGECFQPIPAHLGFVYSALNIPQDDGRYKVKGLGDHDYIHEHKNLINPLDYRARVMMMMGNYIVHMNHLDLVTILFDIVPWLDKRSLTPA